MTAGPCPVGRRDSLLAYPALLLLGVVDAAGYSVIAPVLPSISASTGAGPSMIGALVASFPAGMLLGFWMAGERLKRHGSDALLAIGLGLLPAGCVGFIAGDDLTAYFPARAAMGLGSGCLWMGVTFSALERWPGQEYVCMSRIFATYSVGGMLGPALGAVGGVRGPFAAFLTLVVVSIAAVVLMGPPARRQAFGSDRSALRLPAFRLAAAGILFAVLALGLIEGVLPLHFADRLDQGQLGLLYVATSLVVAVAATVAGSFAPRRMLASAVGLVVTGISLAGAADHLALWVLALALAATGLGIGETGALGILLEAIKTDRIVLAMVVWSQLGIVGYLLGPLAGGMVADSLGFASLGLVPLAAATAVLVLARTTRRTTATDRAPTPSTGG